MSSDTPFIKAFDELISTSFNEYLNLSKTIGDLVKIHSEMVTKAIDEQKKFLLTAAKNKKPNDEQFMNLLKPTSNQIQLIQEFREKNRQSSFFNHLSAISESISALGWVTITPTPGPFVKEMVDSSQFYTNKVLVAYKDKDKTHCDWAKSWLNFLTDLQKYIKQYHTTGLSWNLKGGDIQNGASCVAGPPPPPPPPIDLLSLSSSGATSGDQDARLALMKELSKGTDITKGLKKVTSDQQTHKNPSLRNQAPHPTTKTGNQATTVTGKMSSSVKPPKFELEGKKWIIEYQNNANQLTVESEEMNQSISIYKCNNTVITIKGKANSITVDSCTKVGIVFDDIVSFVEIINSQSIQTQSLGHLPTINIEKSDSVQVYLSAKSINAEIVTAKSSSINVSVPDKTNEFVEYPLPEQFKSIWTGKGFKTTPTEIAG